MGQRYVINEQMRKQFANESTSELRQFICNTIEAITLWHNPDQQWTTWKVQDEQRQTLATFDSEGYETSNKSGRWQRITASSENYDIIP